MTHDRWLELMHPDAESNGINLTIDEIASGWHWCADWDGLLIHVDDDEFQACNCCGSIQEYQQKGIK